jgi:capsular exopolysaccharide synthesis family protein
MELRDYMEILSRRKWVIILTTIFALATVAVGVTLIPPEYTATTKVRVLTPRTGSVDFIDYNVGYSERLIATYVEIASSTPVIEELGQYVEPLPNRDAIQVNALTDTELIEIAVTDQDPLLAQHAANNLAEILIAHTRDLYRDQENPVKLYVVDPATVPENPSSPAPWLIISLGLVGGLFGGVGLAFLFENLDTRIYSTKEIESLTDLNLIGDLPSVNKADDLLVLSSRIHAEAFKRLRTNVLAIANEEGLNSLLVTSAVTKDGRTTVAANLAVSMSQANFKVILVDANFRNPQLHKVFDLKDEYGFNDILQQNVELSEAIQESKIPGVDLLAGGYLPANASELLSTEKMHETLEQLEQRYDYVLLDSPASLSVTDPAVLASKVDGVLLVVRHGWVRREALQATLHHLRNVNANIIGVVANQTKLGVGSRFADMKPAE